MQDLIRQKSFLRWLILFSVAASVVFLPVNYFMIHEHPHNDYRDHIQFARQYVEGREMPEHIAAHPAWQYSIAFLSRLGGFSLENAAVILQTLLDIALVLILFVWIKTASPNPAFGWAGVLALGCSIAAPLMLPAFFDGLFYLGYIGITSYHNPTIIMLRPFAVLLFIFSVALVCGRRFPIWQILLSAVLIVVSALAKPNQLVCLLPSVGILLLTRLIRRESFDGWYAAFGLFLPAVIVLAWQFLAAFGGDEGGIRFAPLGVMREYSGLLLPKFILSLWFPLFVSVFSYKTVRRDPLMLLAWLAFCFGAAFTYLLAEGSARFQDGNWGWSGEIALFLLFAASVVHWVRFQTEMKRIWQKRLVWWGGFAPQVLAGMAYLAHVVVSRTFR